MIRQAGYRAWRDVPVTDLIKLLNRLNAGVVYCPQQLPDRMMSLALVPRRADDQLVSAVEGLDLAIAIADELGLDYSIYSHEQATIRGIRNAVLRQSPRRRMGQLSFER